MRKIFVIFSVLFVLDAVPSSYAQMRCGTECLSTIRTNIKNAAKDSDCKIFSFEKVDDKMQVTYHCTDYDLKVIYPFLKINQLARKVDSKDENTKPEIKKVIKDFIKDETSKLSDFLTEASFITKRDLTMTPSIDFMGEIKAATAAGDDAAKVAGDDAAKVAGGAKEEAVKKAKEEAVKKAKKEAVTKKMDGVIGGLNSMKFEFSSAKN